MVVHCAVWVRVLCIQTNHDGHSAGPYAHREPEGQAAEPSPRAALKVHVAALPRSVRSSPGPTAAASPDGTSSCHHAHASGPAARQAARHAVALGVGVVAWPIASPLSSAPMMAQANSAPWPQNELPDFGPEATSFSFQFWPTTNRGLCLGFSHRNLKQSSLPIHLSTFWPVGSRKPKVQPRSPTVSGAASRASRSATISVMSLDASAVGACARFTVSVGSYTTPRRARFAVRFTFLVTGNG